MHCLQLQEHEHTSLLTLTAANCRCATPQAGQAITMHTPDSRTLVWRLQGVVQQHSNHAGHQSLRQQRFAADGLQESHDGDVDLLPLGWPHAQVGACSTCSDLHVCLLYMHLYLGVEQHKAAAVRRHNNSQLNNIAWCPAACQHCR